VLSDVQTVANHTRVFILIAGSFACPTKPNKLRKKTIKLQTSRSTFAQLPAQPTAMATTDPVPELRRVLCDDASPNLALRFRALFSLKHLATQGNTAAVEAIAAAFISDSALLKHELAYCLGQSKQSSAAAPLQAVLQDEAEDPMVRHEAGEALGALGHTPSLELLRGYIGHKEEVISQTCELAVARIEWEASEAAKAEELQTSAFASIDPAPPLPGTVKEVDCAALQAKLNDQTLPLFERYRAMFRLRDIASPEAIDALASGLSDPSALFRHEASAISSSGRCLDGWCSHATDCIRIRPAFGPTLDPCADQSGRQHERGVDGAARSGRGPRQHRGREGGGVSQGVRQRRREGGPRERRGGFGHGRVREEWTVRIRAYPAGRVRHKQKKKRKEKKNRGGGGFRSCLRFGYLCGHMAFCLSGCHTKSFTFARDVGIEIEQL